MFDVTILSFRKMNSSPKLQSAILVCSVFLLSFLAPANAQENGLTNVVFTNSHANNSNIDSAIFDGENNYGSNDLWEKMRSSFGISATNDPAVKKFENFYATKRTFLNRVFNRARIYLPFIMAEVERRGLPAELALLPVVESGFNPRSYSNKGAAGLWQFMTNTGWQYGLKQDSWYEGRRDIVESTNAALDHLHYLYLVFNDWSLALGAYNAGEYGIKKAMQINAMQKKSTYFEHLKLASETRDYVPKLFALRNIISDPERFNIELPVITMKPAFESVSFSHQVSIDILASETGITSHELKALNPALRRKVTPPKGPHTILVPSEKTAQVIAWKGRTSASLAVQSLDYVVESGDTLSEIANRFGISVTLLKNINSLTSDLIRIGDKLRLPLSNSIYRDTLVADVDSSSVSVLTHEVLPGDTIGTIAQSYGVSSQQLIASNSLSTHIIRVGEKLKIPKSISQFASGSSDVSSASSPRVVHIVQSGESLWRIARRYDTRVSYIVYWNNLNTRRYIRPGQQILIYSD